MNLTDVYIQSVLKILMQSKYVIKIIMQVKMRDLVCYTGRHILSSCVHLIIDKMCVPFTVYSYSTFTLFEDFWSTLNIYKLTSKVFFLTSPYLLSNEDIKYAF
jgi:hypothetical protein